MKKSGLAFIKQFFLSNYYIFTLFGTNKRKQEIQVQNNPYIEAKKSKTDLKKKFQKTFKDTYCSILCQQNMNNVVNIKIKNHIVNLGEKSIFLSSFFGNFKNEK